LSVTNSTLAGNVARANASSSGTSHARGGGIDANVAKLTLTNATVARNNVGGSGGTKEQLGGGVDLESGPGKLRSTILALNNALTGPNCYGTIGSGGHNLLGTKAGCIFTSATGDKLNKAPKLGPLTANGGSTRTMALLGGSPALDAIPKADCLVPVDQRGVSRPQHPRCDMERTSARPECERGDPNPHALSGTGS
jgi:hypothetical protein